MAVAGLGKQQMGPVFNIFERSGRQVAMQALQLTGIAAAEEAAARFAAYLPERD